MREQLGVRGKRLFVGFGDDEEVLRVGYFGEA